MTLVAWESGRVAGLARSTADPDFEVGECAVIIRGDLRERGLATQLLKALLSAIAAQGVRQAVFVFRPIRRGCLTSARTLDSSLPPLRPTLRWFEPRRLCKQMLCIEPLFFKCG
jgi:hypothetical protein